MAMCMLIGKWVLGSNRRAGKCMVDTPSQNPGPTPDRVVRSFWHGQFSPQ